MLMTTMPDGVTSSEFRRITGIHHEASFNMLHSIRSRLGELNRCPDEDDGRIFIELKNGSIVVTPVHDDRGDDVLKDLRHWLDHTIRGPGAGYLQNYLNEYAFRINRGSYRNVTIPNILGIGHVQVTPMTRPVRRQLGHVIVKRVRSDDRMQSVATRGNAGLAFQKNVIAAYRGACFVCGLRFPSAANGATGVDAAHILPWSEYDMDVTHNGMCLCKLHHWAFDQKIIAIHHGESGYCVKITESARDMMKDDPATIAEFERISGVIPSDRLPSSPSDWPSVVFLAKFYEDTAL